MRLYRGLTREYDPNYNNGKGGDLSYYNHYTDSEDLARAYGDNVIYIDVDDNLIKDSVIDEDPNSETYGDRNLIYRTGKKAGLKGKSGNEYALYLDHDIKLKPQKLQATKEPERTKNGFPIGTVRKWKTGFFEKIKKDTWKKLESGQRGVK